PHVPDMRWRVDGRTARIHADVALDERNELLAASGEGVVEVHLGYRLSAIGYRLNDILSPSGVLGAIPERQGRARVAAASLGRPSGARHIGSKGRWHLDPLGVEAKLDSATQFPRYIPLFERQGGRDDANGEEG